MKRILIMIICVCSLITGCEGASLSKKLTPEEESVAIIEKYMTAIEQNDLKTMMDCFDPAIREGSAAIADAFGNSLGISNANDIGLYARSAMLDAIHRERNFAADLEYQGVDNSSFEENIGKIEVIYNVKIHIDDIKAEALAKIPFDMVKKKDKWYISEEGDSEFLEEPHIVTDDTK